jgi:hypothetical protein
VACLRGVVACMAETIILDPSAVATNRTQVDITAFVADTGVDWGDAAIEAYMAEASRGQFPVDFRFPNRIIQIPLKLQTRGATSFETARSQMQAKVGLFQRQGGWLSRTTAVGTLYADVVNATLKMGGSWYQANSSFDPDAILTLECIPDFYGAEIDLGDNVETTNSAIVFTDTGVKGDYPGRMRLVVDEDQGQNQRGMIYGLRSLYYSSSAAARLRYPASELTSVATTVQSDWTVLFSTDRDSGTAPLGAMVHQGTYRVWIKATLSANKPTVRLAWAVGDLLNAVYNDPSTVDSTTAGSFLLDLGEVRLDASPVGTHQWKGLIQAKGSSVSLTLEEFWRVPVDEGYGTIRAITNTDPGITVYSGQDSFDQTTGALTGKTANVGGTWVGAGDADDFQVVATDEITRTAVSDASAATGRLVTLNTNNTTIVSQVDFKYSAYMTGTDQLGVIARYVDANNWFSASVANFAGSAGGVRWSKVVGGVLTSGENSVSGPYHSMALNAWWTIRLEVNTDGTWTIYFGPQGGALTATMSGSDTALATGGTLATGDVGIVDARTTATASTRTYDNFAAYVPNVDAVIYASQSIELRHDGMYRENSSGSTWVPIIPRGDLLRLPPAGLEARTAEVFVKASRGDLETYPDAGTDDISARLYYRPSWLFVPVA